MDLSHQNNSDTDSFNESKDEDKHEHCHIERKHTKSYIKRELYIHPVTSKKFTSKMLYQDDHQIEFEFDFLDKYYKHRQDNITFLVEHVLENEAERSK